jgi:hypothetical protein
MEDANGEFAGRKVLYLDPTTPVEIDGMDEHQARLCYRGLRVRDAAPATVRSFSPAPDEADHNLPSLRHIAPLHGRKVGL